MTSPLGFWPLLLRPSRPRHITLWVTDRCNQSCVFCFQRGEAADEAGGEELSLAEMARLAPSLGRPLWLLIGGGEPYLRPDLAELCGVLLAASRPAILTLTSNGSMPEVVEAQTRDIMARAGESLVVVKLSLDGLEATHDHLRASPGSFARVMETHHRLRRLADQSPGLELGFNSVLCAANRAEMPRLAELVASLPGRPAHTISLVRGNLPQPALAEVTPDEYERATARLEGVAARHRFAGAGLKAALDRAQHRLIARTLRDRRRPIPCRAGWQSLVITAQGRVLTCELERVSLGDLRAHGMDLDRLLAADQARAARRYLASAGCWCSHECNALINLLGHAPAWPGLAWDWLRSGRRPTLQ